MLTLLTPLTYLSLFSILWFAVARFIVRERYLGQLYMDTPILLRHINTFTLLLLIVVHILYIAILYRSYVDSFKSYNIFILFMVFVQTICAVFMDQGQGYTVSVCLPYYLFNTVKIIDSNVWIVLVHVIVFIKKCAYILSLYLSSSHDYGTFLFLSLTVFKRNLFEVTHHRCPLL